MKYLFLIEVFTVFLHCLSAQNVYEQVEAVLERTAELPCNISAETEGDKLNILAWYKDGSSKAFYSRDLREGNGTVSSEDKRYRLVSSEGTDQIILQILETRASDAGLYTCNVHFASSPTRKTFLELTVIEPPQQLWVIHENGTRVGTSRAGVNTSRNIGPYYVGDTIHLYCVSINGKPQPSVFWWSKKRMLKIKDSSIPLSEMRVRSVLSYGPLEREDHGHVITCFAKNNNHTTPLYIDVVINMFLPPALVALRDPEGKAFNGGRVEGGASLALQCRVLDARPTPDIEWRLNDTALSLNQNVTDMGQRLVVSDVQLYIEREYDESRITCCVPAQNRDEDRHICATPLTLVVTYKPVLQIVVTEELDDNVLYAAKGATVVLKCIFDANPAPYLITWFHQENEVFRDNSRPLKGILVLENITTAEAGEYACAADNDVGYDYSEPIIINVTYPAFCKNEGTVQYGIREDESVNITCDVDGNPPPDSYRWVIVKDAVNASTLRDHAHTTEDTDEPVLVYQRPNDTMFSTVFCWGMNNVSSNGQPHTPCVALVSDETPPWPPTGCEALKNSVEDIEINCEKGHDGGSPQKFLCILRSTKEPDMIFTSITRSEPTFVVNEPNEEEYEIIIIASNDKGNSTLVEISKRQVLEIPDEEVIPSAVEDITTLALALCGGVALVALAACGLVLCARERAERADIPHARSDPPLCAYNTEESNCETYHDSDESECNVRRTESFRRAMAKYPSKNFDVRRTSSFHSARYMNEMAEQEAASKFNEGLRHSASCRMHSLQNISRKRDMDALCDHLVMHLPPETNYPGPRPMNTFYTMPRKMRNKLAKELSDETSEITQASDGFSLPPPPDEYGTYRAGTRIRDMPTKTAPTYTTIVRKNSAKEQQKQQYNNVIMSPMNTVGLPTISGQPSVYSYPDDQNQQALQMAPATLTTFQSYSSPKESGL